MDAIKARWRGYAKLKGRTLRTTFWSTTLFLFLAGMTLSALFPGAQVHTNVMDHNFVSTKDFTVHPLWSVATLPLSLAIRFRRLQDLGKSGKAMFWVLLPIVGWFKLLVWLLTPG